jgi:glycosidase
MMKKSFIVLLLIFAAINISKAQKISVDKIEPPNWWVGMKLNQIQLMVYGKNLENIKVESENDDLIVNKIHQVKNDSYLFVDVEIKKSAEPGDYEFYFYNDRDTISYTYRLLERELQAEEHRGFSNEDVIYLIFPDRFTNGDYTNDLIENDYESYGFGSLNGRHGGDIAGMISKLDYIKDFGFTAIWSTPMLENNMYMSYHGYAATDLYKIDSRFGSNELYKKFAEEARGKGLKIIYDHVANHIGVNHHWISNPPMEGWINGTVENHAANLHNKMSAFDVNSDSLMIVNSQTGWFTNYMPDLNHKNEYVANYVIQNTLWWIEYAGIDGIREDTYPYNDINFMGRWAETILNEYPNFNIVGEVWKGQTATLASYQSDSKLQNSVETNLPTVTDFALRDELTNFLQGKNSLQAVYEIFAKDYLYSNPNNLLVFLDNHDIDRAMFNAGGNIDKFKLALTLILTARGIPQIFYGTEIGINEGSHHGKIRKPFPGGFQNDIKNKFTDESRTEYENEIFNYLKKLLHIRKNNKALASGKFLHYPPINDVYAYFKENAESKYFIMLNGSGKVKDFALEYLQYKFTDNSRLTDLLTDEIIELEPDLKINLSGYGAKVFKVE